MRINQISSTQNFGCWLKYGNDYYNSDKILKISPANNGSCKILLDMKTVTGPEYDSYATKVEDVVIFAKCTPQAFIEKHLRGSLINEIIEL